MGSVRFVADVDDYEGDDCEDEEDDEGGDCGCEGFCGERGAAVEVWHGPGVLVLRQ